jgi:hypothetical protein
MVESRHFLEEEKSLLSVRRPNITEEVYQTSLTFMQIDVDYYTVFEYME